MLRLPSRWVLALAGAGALGCSDARFASQDAGAESSGGSGAHGQDSGGSGGAKTGTAGAISTTLVIGQDNEDAVWLNGTDEAIHHGPDLFVLEVGADAEAARTGLIFHLPAPAGSVVNSARLHLYRVQGDAAPTETMQVQVWDSCQVAPFSDAHGHTPAEHVPEGLWPTAVTGFAVGVDGTDITSPELAVLVQHIVDKPEWTTGATVGFLLSPDQMQSWVMFADSSAGTGAPSLDLTYTP